MICEPCRGRKYMNNTPKNLAIRQNLMVANAPKSDFSDISSFSRTPCLGKDIWPPLHPVRTTGSNGRSNTIWYKAVFKGGVYETRETVWAFSGAEERRVASLEVGADVA